MGKCLPPLLLWFTVPILGQVHLGAGLKAGVPMAALTEGVSGAQIVQNRTYWWTLGPTFELDLPLRLGVEVDALVRRVGYDGAPGQGPRSTVWDFPLLAKYRFSSRRVQPYAGGGWTYRRLGDLLQSPQSSRNGTVVSAGVRVGAKRIRISPEIRFTHWPNPDIQPGFRTRRNQVEVLAGLTF